MKKWQQVQYSGYFPKKQFEGLKKLVKDTRVTMAEYIREGVDMVLEKYGYGDYTRDDND